MFTADTIVALASPPQGGGRGIVRVSGPAARECLSRCFAPNSSSNELENARAPTVISGWLQVGGGGLPCDLYWWPGVRSYTRQPLGELHTLGSPPLLAAVVRGLCNAGARLAAPGEFTLRAFLAGRLDLTQAEAVLGVIDARDQAELSGALAQLSGGLSAPLAQLRGALLDLLAHLEAGLDFVEDDIRFIEPAELDGQLAAALAIIDRLSAQLAARGEFSDAPRVVLAGPPNAGKSSLFNALVERYGTAPHQALVSAEAGTTRDYLTAELTLAGQRCWLVDTAGFEGESAAASEAPHGEIESAARTMTGGQLRQARLKLQCRDAALPGADLSASAGPATGGELWVWTKLDRPADLAAFGERLQTLNAAAHACCVSSQTSLGIDRLAEAIAARLASDSNESGVVAGTALRCRESVRRAGEALDRARALGAGNEELVAVELRTALDELGQVVGAVYTDDILDRIFSRFCIGK